MSDTTTLILVELDYVGADGQQGIARFSSAAFTTGRADTPPDTSFLPLLDDAPELSLSAFTDGSTGGTPRRKVGKISLSNADGRLDWLLAVAVDGRALRVRIGPQGGRYPQDFAVWMNTVAEGIECSRNDRLDIVISDGMAAFDKEVTNTLYKGDNVAPLGVEGTENDLKDKPKPRLFGRCDNITPVCVNPWKLIYQVNDGTVHDIPAAYDRGVALSRGPDAADLDDLMNNAPDEAHYRVWLAGGLLRVGSAVSGLTADVLEGATPADRTVAQILTRVADIVGHTDIDWQDVHTLDVLQPAETGVYITGADTALRVMDTLAAGIGAWVSIDGGGALRMGRLDAPAGQPVVTLHDYLISDIKLLRSRDTGGGRPAKKISIEFGYNWTRQSDNSIAGSVDVERKAWLEQQTRTAVWEDDVIAQRHLMAADFERSTPLLNRADADAELERLAGLYSVPRLLLRLKVSRPEMLVRFPLLMLGDLVEVFFSRYGLQEGRLMRVIAITSRAASDLLELDLWG